MKTTKINQRVAYESNKDEFKKGVSQSNPNHNDRVLVKFDLGYSRWVNNSNLHNVTKR